MLAEELSVIDADAPLWDAIRPLLAAALQLEQNGDAYTWHGWQKQQVCTFLKGLPAHCTLVIGVWDTLVDEEDGGEREVLVLGCVCEIIEGELYSLRTFKVLSDPALPALDELEPGFEHAREIMRVVRQEVAPVAWALFTDKTTWDTWLFATADDGGVLDKGALLAQYARQGRCVLMGSQTMRH